MNQGEVSGRTDFINCNLSQTGLGEFAQDLEERTFTKREFGESYEWIGEELKIRLSKYKNDTLFHQNLMNRFYHKYSSSQDYYYRNHISNILTETPTSAVINWFDMETMLDEDEYFKRFYESDEYEGKIKLLSEYYKFHRDIPRIFSVPASRALNKYHDQRRKIEYHKIKKMLVEEALKKNKKVAMNEDDNEIRLTDGDVQQSEGGEREGEEENSRADDTSSIDLPLHENQKVLPEQLIHSLYKEGGQNGNKNRAKCEVSNQTIEFLQEGLSRAWKDRNKANSGFSSFDLTKSNWEKNFDNTSLKDKTSGQKSDINSGRDSLRKTESLAFKPVNLQITDQNAKNIKDVNLNINLNLRVLKEQIASSSEYNCFIPSGSLTSRGHKTEKPHHPSSEFKKFAKNKKLSTEENIDFKKKSKPDELRASLKDHSVESKLLRKQYNRSKKHLIDSENSLSQKRLLMAPQIPVTKLQMHTFSKFMKDMGGEYKKATVKTMKLRRSRNLENILVRYKPQQDKTPDIDNTRKESSEKRGNFSTRSRVHGERSVKARGTTASSRGFEKPAVQRSSPEKLHFKKKKLSLHQHNLHSSKELSKNNLNLDAASLYQTNPFKLSKRQQTMGSKPVDAIDLIKDKYNGSVSARTKMTTRENSILNNVVSSMSSKMTRHKLSLSNSLAQNAGAPQKLFSLNVNPQTALHGAAESKDLRGSKSRRKKEARSKSIKGGSTGGTLQPTQLQNSKFAKLMYKELRKKQDCGDGTKKSFAEATSYRPHNSKERFGSPSDGRDKSKLSHKTIKIAGHTFKLEKLPTSHCYSKSEMSKAHVLMALSNGQQSRFKTSISGSRNPSAILHSKLSK